MTNRLSIDGGSNIWSEPDIKQSSDADEERQAAARAALENQEGIDDPVRMYLREIGKALLLSAADEKRLARQMEEGQHIEAIENTWQQEREAEPSAVDIALTLFEQLSLVKPVLDLAVKHLHLPKQSSLADRLGDPTVRALIDAEMDPEFTERVARTRQFEPEDAHRAIVRLLTS